MGLLLSVLVVCVGVIELLAVYKNVRRNLTYPPAQGNLASLKDRYHKERRKVCDLEDLHGEAALPTFRLNSHEDVEIEYDESVVRSRSPSPRTFLVTEKEIENNSDKANPRRFVVTEDASGSLRKTKSQDSIPEFLIREEKNSSKSPDKPRYLLQESAGRSESPIPLPRQFIVTEDELNTVVFDTTSKLIHSKTQSKHEGHKRPLSPYPSLDLPQTPLVPRNSICNDLDESVEEWQDENSRSSSPERVDVILEQTSSGTTQYRTNKVLVSPSDNSLLLKKHSRNPMTPSSEERVGNDDNVYDAEYLNNLDGVSKAKPIRRGSSSRKSVKRKYDKPSSSNSQDVRDSDDTTKVLSSAAEELKRVSGDATSGKEAEPFWLIFSGEYTKAMNKDWHGQHFCCWQCDESLTGQRYVLRDDHPYCVSCYESVFANACEKCSRIIGIDSKDLSYKDKHWHEACFNCTTCGESLVDKQFGSKGDRIYCGSCYDQQFASRCDGCHEIFRAGELAISFKLAILDRPKILY
nr:unnamed protein product [Callosobruchus chinensis]